MQKYLTSTLILAFILLPITADARHNDRWGVDTSSLDDDPVKTFPIPVLFGVLLSRLTPDFADPRGDGSREHEGQDMLAPEGTPIVSPTEAVVLSTGSGDSSGKYVYTRNPGGETFRYMHLDSIADLDRGDELAIGDFIGTVGNTGNASGGAHHLHFEVRDEDNDPTDPYPRLKGVFTLKEKIGFLEDMMKAVDDEEEYAEFLVSTFSSEFAEAKQLGYEFPEVFEEIGYVVSAASRAELLKRLDSIMESIPTVLTMELKEGSSGPTVSLLQLYLIFKSEGAARNTLAGTGATGYFGPQTTAAVREFQVANGVAATGVYDALTRSAMLE